MNQGIERRLMTSEQQAYMQYAIEIIRRGSALAMQSQLAANTTMMGASVGSGMAHSSSSKKSYLIFVVFIRSWK